MGFVQFCLTEHMPRVNDKYLYPEEIEKHYDSKALDKVFNSYKKHAREVQKQYEGKMKVLVGFEVEGVDTQHIQLAAELKPEFDMVVGSVHHVFGIPIDFDSAAWEEAQKLTKSNTARELYLEYFKLQHEMIETLKPDVVGHFDLIRLFLSVDVDIENEWPEVWQQAISNIKMVASYGGLFELNSAAIRKGWTTPYPQPDMAKAITSHGGKFCLSDDSHGTKQIGLNYHKVLDYMNELQLQELHYLDRINNCTVVKLIPLSQVNQSQFWKQYNE